MKYFVLSPVVALLCLLSFSSRTYAQIDTLFIEPAGAEICAGECLTFIINDLNNPISNEVVWLISTGETYVTSPTEAFTYCFDFPGDYQIEAFIDSSYVIFPANIFVFEDPPPEIVTISDAFCPANNPDNPPGPANCQKVCAYSSITYEALVFGQPGGSGNVQWTVTGAESFDISPDGTQVTVNWGGPGQGNVSATIFGFCPSTSSICVDIIPDPVAEIGTLPAAVADVVTVCQGQTVYFENLSVGADTYEWDFGIYGTSNDVSPGITFPDPGTYEIGLVARNACFCNDSTSVTVEVLPAEAPVLDCVGTVCPGETTTYTAAVSCSSYTWNVIGDGTITDGGGSTDDFITVTWNSGPEGYIELTVGGCTGNVCSETLVQLIPVIDDDAPINGPTEVCRGAIVTYSITPYDGTEYNWSVSNFGTILDGQGTNTIRVAWDNIATVNNMQWVECVYENCWLECGGEAQLDVGILNEFYVNGPLEVCENGQATFDAQNVLPGPSFGWDWTLTDDSGTTVWTSNGTFSETIDFTYGAGSFILEASPVNPTDYCEDIYRLLLNVRPAPLLPDGILGPTDICPGQEYTYQVENPVGGADYRWYVNDGGTVSVVEGNPAVVTWGNNPPYELSLVRLSTDGLQCESDPVQINLQEVGTPTLNGPTTACREDNSLISATDFPGLTYTWSVSPADIGTIVSGQGTSVVEIRWHAAGLATVSLDFCGGTYDQNLTILDLPQPSVNAPAGLCAGETGMVVTTTAYAAYAWFDDSGTQISTAPDPQLGPGHYEVQVTDFQGCAGNASFFMDSYELPAASISTPDNQGYCAGDPIPTLYALDAEDAYSYQWYYNGLPFGGNSSTILSIGYGDYYVEVTNNYGCTATSNTINLFEFCDIPGGICNGTGAGLPPTNCDPGTDVTFSWAANPSDCNTIDFTNTSTSFQPGTQEWIFDDGSTSTDPAPTHTYNGAGYYAVILTGLNAAGEFCWQSQPVEVPVAADFDYIPACAGDAMDFEDISSFVPGNTIAVWSWDFGDPASGPQNMAFAENPQHVFATPGTYNVTLTVTDLGGCQSTIVQPVEVFAPPVADFTLPSLDCEGTPLAFNANVGAEVVEVNWDFGDPASGAANTSDQFSAFHNFAAPGNYNVTMTATSVYGCSTVYSDVVVVEPNPLSGPVTVAPSAEICEGSTTDLTAPGGGISWNWSTGETSETITVSTSGLYTVTVTDANGCTYVPAAANITVNPSPTNEVFAIEYDEYGQAVNYSFDTYVICEGEDVYLNVFDIPGQTYVWSNGETSTENIFAEWRDNELTVGTYDFTVEVTNSLTGCSATVGPFEVTVNPVPADVTINADNNPPCAGELTNLSVDSPDPALTYVWNTGQAGTDITVSNPGEYFVTAFNSSGCGTESNRLTVFPGPDITKVPSGCYTRCNPDTLCLPALNLVTSYQWYFNGNPIPAPEGTIADLVATQSGTYYVEMTDIFGCTQTSDPLNLDLFDGFGDINGTVYLDVNESGTFDAGDTPVPDIDFILLDENGNPMDTISSDGTGGFGFPGIIADDYTVQIDTFTLPPNTTWQLVQQPAQLVGCDDEESQIWLIIPFCPSTSGALDVAACVGETYDYDGTAIPAGSSQVFTLTNAAGCDSILTVNVAAIPSTTGTLNVSACAGENYDYNGTPVPAGSSQVFTLMNAAGCDSLLTVAVSELSSSSADLTFSACPGETYDYNGTSIPVGESQVFTLTNAVGCDSLVTVTVDALPEDAETLNVTACNGEPYFFDGVPLMGGTSTDFTFTNTAGCDSVVTVVVASVSNPTTFVDLEVCPGETVTFNGQEYSAGAQESFIFTDQNGCDSLVELSVIAYDAVNFSIAGNPVCWNGLDGSLEVLSPQGGTPPYEYSLEGGAWQTNPVFEGLAPGNYLLEVRDDNGCVYDTDAFLEEIAPLEATVETEPLPCSGDPANVYLEVSSGDWSNALITWPDGSDGLNWSAAQPGPYSVQMENACELITREFSIELADDGRVSYLYMPNVFSPDGDGINDTWQVFPATGIRVEYLEVKIFDRWGNFLYEFYSTTDGWDGMYRSEAMNPGVYVYYVVARVVSCGREIELYKEGDITIVR